MRKVTLVCSQHDPSSFSNPDELLDILQALQPEVVFEEIRPLDFDSFYKHEPGPTLEIQTIKRYRRLKSLKQIPVDQFDLPKNFLEIKREIERGLSHITTTSEEWQRLNFENNKSVYEKGIRYINSDACATTLARMSAIEDEKIRETHDQSLIDAQQWWRNRIKERELAMVQNIYAYCRENAFDAGVFLVGAGHRTGLAKQIKNFAAKEADLIAWNLYDGQVP